MSDAASAAIVSGLEAGAACLEAALAYLKMGWSVLCLCPPDHVGVGRWHGKTCPPNHWGKRPCGNEDRWKEYQQRLPTEDEVRGWWRAQQNANVGAVTGGVSGILRVDAEGKLGHERLLELSAGDLPITPEFTTGKPDGRGWLYRIPEGVVLHTGVEGLADGDELRFQATGAQTVLPPSRHRSGRQYAWAPGRSPWDMPLAPMPQWMLERLTTGRKVVQTEAPADGEIIPVGRRDTTLTRWAGVMRHHGFSVEAIRAALATEIAAGRCDTKQGEKAYDESDAQRIAGSVGRYEPDAYANTQVTIRVINKPSGLEGAALASGELEAAVVSSMTEKPVRWLVPGVLPLGKIVLLAGDGGQGKSVLTLALAADLSQGKPCLGLHYPLATTGESLFACCEDDYADTIKPRLLAHGADCSKIYAILGVKDDKGKTQPFSLLDLEALEKHLEKHPQVRLVVIDPAGAYIGRTGVDDYKDSQLRALLGPLSDLAARRNVLIVLVKHLTKGATSRAVHKVGGSAGYVNASRATFLVCPDPEDEGRKLFLCPKFNLGDPPKTRAYRMVPLAEEEQDSVTAGMTHLFLDDRRLLGRQLFRVTWEDGTVEMTAEEAMNGHSNGHRGPGRPCKKGDATDWLRSFLDQYAYPVDEVLAAASKAGFQRSLIYLVKKEMGKEVSTQNLGRNGWWGLGPPDDWTTRPEKPPENPGRTPFAD